MTSAPSARSARGPLDDLRRPSSRGASTISAKIATVVVVQRRSAWRRGRRSAAGPSVPPGPRCTGMPKCCVSASTSPRQRPGTMMRSTRRRAGARAAAARQPPAPACGGGSCRPSSARRPAGRSRALPSVKGGASMPASTRSRLRLRQAPGQEDDVFHARDSSFSRRIERGFEFGRRAHDRQKSMPRSRSTLSSSMRRGRSVTQSCGERVTTTGFGVACKHDARNAQLAGLREHVGRQRVADAEGALGDRVAGGRRDDDGVVHVVVEHAHRHAAGRLVAKDP